MSRKKDKECKESAMRTSRKAPARNHSAVLLTHWDPGFYPKRAVPSCVRELVIYALTFDRVVFRACDFFLNSTISRHLVANEDELALFEELLLNGCFTFLTTHPEKYQHELEADPSVTPLAARMEEQEKYRTVEDRPYVPEEWQRRLWHRLDGVIGKAPQNYLTFANDLPQENKFALQLAKILDRPGASDKFSRIKQFRGIDVPTIKAFVAFCTIPGRWKDFLYRKGVRHFRREEFFRSEAYECANFFPNPSAITNLCQSVYMALECNRERLDGRWGDKLQEPPYSFANSG